MNLKQKLSVLFGVVAVGFGILNAIYDLYHPGFDIYLVVVVLVTTGCVYIFKDKKNKQV